MNPSTMRSTTGYDDSRMNFNLDLLSRSYFGIHAQEVKIDDLVSPIKRQIINLESASFGCFVKKILTKG